MKKFAAELGWDDILCPENRAASEDALHEMDSGRLSSFEKYSLGKILNEDVTSRDDDSHSTL